MGCGCNKNKKNNPPLKRERIVRSNVQKPKQKNETKKPPTSNIIKPLPRKKRK